MARDKRISSDNSALRKSRPLSFLKESRSSAEEEDDTIDCLYESQWSCVVTGLNDTVWNVIVLPTHTFTMQTTNLTDQALNITKGVFRKMMGFIGILL